VSAERTRTPQAEPAAPVLEERLTTGKGGGMKTVLVFAAGLAAGAIAVQLLPARAQQNEEPAYQMILTGGSQGGPDAYVLNRYTGALRYCNGKECWPVKLQ
jgi:hypothetical protein